MIEQIEQYCDQNDLLLAKSSLIVGVSGGVDSMVLLDVMRQIAPGRSIKLIVAHMNYQLRGEASDQDEQLVKDYCVAHGLTFLSKRVDTNAYAQIHKVGTQLAARQLRYEWFESLKQANDTRIAVAHHADDNVETILYNLTKGTGIKGVRGMRPLNKVGVIRPLLSVTKDQLLTYAQSHQIVWREDATNQKTDYTRNLIRLQVMPVLKRINPAMVEHFDMTHTRLLALEDLLADDIHRLKSKYFSQTVNRDVWDISWVKDQRKDLLLVSELLSTYQVSFRDAIDIHQAILQPMGQVFTTSTYQINVDRDRLLISPLETIRPEAPMPILEGETELQYGKWEYRMSYQNAEKVKITADRNKAYLDADLLEFPLTLRKWQEGDRMQPFGMHGQKKISDMLIDSKISNLDKAHIHVLVSGEAIIWLCGVRIGHNCRVTNQTKNMMIIEQIPIESN